MTLGAFTQRGTAVGTTWGAYHTVNVIHANNWCGYVDQVEPKSSTCM